MSPRRLLSAGRARLVPLLLASALAACGGSGGAKGGELGVELVFDPSPPRIGDVEVEVLLTDGSGAPLDAASVRVEGNMNHAGMVPEIAEAEELEPGRWAAQLEFTMGGDWFFVITAVTEDGERLERVIDVPGVSSEELVSQ